MTHEPVFWNPREGHELTIIDNIAIVMPCVRRPDISVSDSIENIRHGGFKQIHVSLEPDIPPETVSPEMCARGISPHWNRFKYGVSLHLMYCWKWILETTDKPWMMLVENDVRFCKSVSESLGKLIEREKENSIGLVSMFTPNQYLADIAHQGLKPDVDGWVDYRPGYAKASAGQCMCIRRDILRMMTYDTRVTALDHSINQWMKARDLPCWHAIPSLAQHISTFSAAKSEDWTVGIEYQDDR